MQLETFRYTSHGGWDRQPNPALDSPDTLVLAFGPADLMPLTTGLSTLRACFPSAVWGGASTAGEILDRNVDDDTLTVAVARYQRYDLILMDIQMPQLKGLDATRAIRADSPNQHTPILAMTTNVFEQDRQACLDAGMNEHLAKPVVPEVLYASLLLWLAEAGQGGSQG